MNKQRMPRFASHPYVKQRIAAAGLLTCVLLSGCSLSQTSPGDEISEGFPAVEEQKPPEDFGQTQEQDSSADDGGAMPDYGAAVTDYGAAEPNNGTAARSYPRGNKITEQTFDVTLRPLGEVTFASYEPDTSDNPLADVVFLIEKDGEVLMQLSGATEDNVGLEAFNQVEAVSFLDYNHDDYDDIIIILSYDFGAGPQAATPHSLIRYYRGTAQDGFIYEEQMSQDASTALAEITVETARNFISGIRVDESASQETADSLEPWQQAYIQYLTNDSVEEAQRGYTLIPLSDDGIPQIVEVGNDEATGCRVVHYADGKAHVTQLNRLFFSYIPGGNLLCNSEGNMDYYYDLVYRLEDGELTLIASGYYGAEDNSNVKYDAQGEPIYQYEWEGVPMSREEYQTAHSKVYDFSKAVENYDYDSLYSLEEIKKMIGEYTN